MAIEDIACVVVVVIVALWAAVIAIVSVVIVIIAHGGKFLELTLLLLILILIVVLTSHILLLILLELPLRAHKALRGRIFALIIVSLLAVARVVMARRPPIRHVPLVLFEVSLHLCWVEVVAIRMVHEPLDAVLLLSAQVFRVA